MLISSRYFASQCRRRPWPPTEVAARWVLPLAAIRFHRGGRKCSLEDSWHPMRPKAFENETANISFPVLGSPNITLSHYRLAVILRRRHVLERYTSNSIVHAKPLKIPEKPCPPKFQKAQLQTRVSYGNKPWPKRGQNNASLHATIAARTDGPHCHHEDGRRGHPARRMWAAKFGFLNNN